MSTLTELLTNAIRLHQTGRLQEAEQLYRQILQNDPAQPDALHNLGFIGYQVGNLDLAITSMTKSVAIAPHNDGFHSNLGLAYHAAGRLEEALNCFRQALRLNPQSIHAHNNLGNALASLGRMDEAANSLQQALRLQPDLAEVWNNLALIKQNQGRLQEAEAHSRQACRLKPDNAEVNHNLATALLMQGKPLEAQMFFEKAVALRPTYAEALSSLATAHQRQGKFREAEKYALQARELRPDIAAIHTNLGSIYQDQRDWEQARRCFEEALRRDPRQAEAAFNLGIVLRSLGHVEEAIALLRQTVQLQPNRAEGFVQLGIALESQHQSEDAVAAFQKALALQPDCQQGGNRLGVLLGKLGRLHESAQCLRQILRYYPSDYDLHNNLGNTLNQLGQLEEAAVHLRQALSIKPDGPEAHHNLGNLLFDKGNLDDAAACFKQALRIKPDKADSCAALGNVLNFQGHTAESVAKLQEALRMEPSDTLRIALATCLPVVSQSLEDLEHWRQRLIEEVRQLHSQSIVVDVTEKLADPLFYLAYQNHNNRDIMREVGHLYRAPDMIAAKPRAAGKVQVGFVSCFFRKHSIGHWMRGLIAQLPRDHLEVVVLSIGNHDDDIARTFKKHADRFVAIPRHLSAARRAIADQKLDLLLYTDIGMDPMTYTLAHSRLAPVQATTLGHPMTTGIDAIDYFISTEALESAESEQHYTETLIRLKNLPIYYYRPQLPDPLKSRSQFGLAEDGTIYACLQTLYKFHPQFDEYLAGILRGDPGGTLILSQGRFPHWERLLRQRFERTLPDVVDRIRFYPMLDYADYLNLLAIADVQLDPMPFGGGSTSYDGMAVGTPIVTLPSNFLRGRITYALYHQMDVLDCVAKSPQDYISLALRLGTDRDYRAMIRQRILDANGVLFENSAGVRELEQVILKVVTAGA